MWKRRYNAVYENAPGIIKVDEIYNNYVNNIEQWEKPSRDDIVKYLCACIRSYSKGNAYAQNFYELIDDNIDVLCNSLYEEMKNEM